MVKESAAKESSSDSNKSIHPLNAAAKYTGVRKRKWGKYVSEIRLPHSRERIWLGSYDTPEKAARAFDAAQFCLRGRSARFNFPDSPPDIAGGQSMSSAEIQRAVALFAHSEPVAATERLPGRINNVDSTSCSISSKSEPYDLHAESSCASVSDGGFQLESDVTDIPLDMISSCASVSDGAFQLESDVTDIPLDMIFLDTMQSENNFLDFEIFPGFDDLFLPSITGVEYREEISDGFSSSQDSSLWNF